MIQTAAAERDSVSCYPEKRSKRIIEFQLEVHKLPNNRKITD